MTNRLLHPTQKNILSKTRSNMNIFFYLFKRVACQCTTDYNSVYHLIATSYNSVYYMHLVTIITPSCNSELQSVLNTLQPSYNCVVEVLATHSTTYCNYVFEKKNFIKYSLHGSRFVKHIFFNNLLQTELKSDIWLRRYHIFFVWNQQKIPCMQDRVRWHHVRTAG